MMEWLSKLPPWLGALALVAIAVGFLFVAITQPPRFEFAGLGFGQKAAPNAVETLPPGAVVAFDLEKGCPPRWTNVTESREGAERFAGRMLLVAADEQLRADENGQSRSTSERQFDDQGGEEAHKLEIDGMPNHDHGGWTGVERIDGDSYTWTSVGNHVFIENTVKGQPFSMTGSRHKHKISDQGGGGAHNNMPPFISLHFCRKD